MKKLLVLTVALLLVFALVACGDEPAATTAATTADTTAPTTTVKADVTTKAPTTATPTVNTTVPTVNTTAPVTTTPVVNTTAPTTTVKVDVTTKAPTTATPTVNTTAPTTTVKEETPEIPDLSGALDLGVAIVEKKIETQSVHDGNLVISLYVDEATNFGQLFYIFDSMSGSSGLCTVKEDYAVDVILNGAFKKNNRFSYNLLDDGSGWFSFEIGSLAEMLDGLGHFTIDATLIVKDALGRAICYANFEDLFYNALAYTPDVDNPGRDRIPVTPVSGPKFGASEGSQKLFDNALSSKLYTNERTPIVFSLANAKALGGISLVTAGDNYPWVGRIVSGFTLYGGNSEDAIDTVILAVTESSMEDVNYTEYYYAIDGAAAYQYYQIVFDDNTNAFQFSEIWVYEAGEFTSSGIKLPTGLVQATVDTSIDIGLEGLAQEYNNRSGLFDSNPAGGKFCCTVVENDEGICELSVYFSLEEATTVTYYTLYTGSDTTTWGRLPKEWVLYGEDADGNWVEISKVDEGMSGLKNSNAVPVSYATTAKESFTNYKFVFITADGTFQLGEIELFANAQ